MTTEQLRERILKRDNYTCVKCHKSDMRLEVDHIIPQYKGGLDGLQNLRTLCHECHKTRHDIDRYAHRFMSMIFDSMLERFGETHLK